jgi:hypothetical protein
MAFDEDPTITWDQVSAGSGWVEKWDVAVGTAFRGICWVKLADGTEDGVELSIGMGEEQQGGVVAIAYQDWKGDLSGVTAGTAASGTSTAPDPASVTAPGGSADNVFLAVSESDSSDDVTAFPTDYDLDQIHRNAGGSSAATLGLAARNLVSATDDPGVFALSGIEEWVANTLVIEPAAAGGINTIIIVPTGPPLS